MELPIPIKPKKIYPRKNSLYFRKWNFLALILKNSLYFLKEKLFPYFLKRKLFLHFHKWSPALLSRSLKSKKISSKKISYTSGNEDPGKFLEFFWRKAFLIFWEKGTRENFLIFQKIELSVLEKWKKPFLKCFLYFRKLNFSIPSLKNTYFF